MRFSFDDFDDCAATLREWQLEAVQLDRGPFRGDLIQAQSATTLVTEATFSRRLHQRGEPPGGLRTVVFPANPSQQIVWRNHRVSGNQLMLFPRGCELDAVSAPGFHVFTISVSEARISDFTHAFGDVSYDDALAGREVLECSPRLMQGLRRAANRYVQLNAILEPAVGPAEAAAREMDSDLMEMLAEALTHEKHPGDAPRQNARDLAVRHCLELVEAHEQTPLSVMDLCQAAGVSRRMLEYAFQDRFGLSPKAYLLARRLNGVRAELKQPSGERSVTHAANSWGFHHMSQLSAFYRRQFGELPSETIRGRGPSCRVSVSSP